MFDDKGDAVLLGLRFPAVWAFFFFESGIGILGLLLITAFPPADLIHWGFDWIQCLLITLPMIALAVVATSKHALKFAPLKGIYDVIRESFLGRFIEKGNWSSFLLVSLAAGIGEELLFRGWLQPQIGLVAASIVFGALHALTFFYLVLATGIGLYLGWAVEWTGWGILPSIVAHSLYDFVALILYQFRIRAESEREAVLVKPESPE